MVAAWVGVPRGLANQLASAMGDEHFVPEEERVARAVAVATLVPKGSVLHLKVSDNDSEWHADFDEELTEEDELYDTDEVEVTISVAETDYDYAEEHLDAFRAKLSETEPWQGVPFGVTLQTFEEEEHERSHWDALAEED